MTVPPIGVLEPLGDSIPQPVQTAIDSLSVPVTTDIDTLALDQALLLAPGESALRSAPIGSTVLPINIEQGIPSVAGESLLTTLRTLLDHLAQRELTTCPTQPVAVLSITAENTLGRAIRDVTVLTDEPARISEFEFARGTGSDTSFALSADGMVSFRADGAVIATPAGTHGYAGTAGNLTISPATGLAVVPIAPFQIDPRQWVLPVEQLTCRIRRQGVPISIQLDGTQRAMINGGDSIEITPAGTIDVLVPALD